MNEERILSIDYGKKRVGIAISDPLNMFAIPLVTIDNNDKFWENFLALFTEYQIKEVLLGYPLLSSGDKSSSTLMVEEFLEELKNKINQNIILRDERYTSSIAQERIISSVTSKKKRRNKGLIDRNAAAVILEEYLGETT
ncbi:MAG: Holliday junction resolvase RuvX [Rhodothermaceae bacterium]